MNVAESLTVTGAGIDTWSPAWKIDSRRLDDQLVSLFNIRGPAGARMMKDPSPFTAHRLGFFPHAGFMFAEGHPAGPNTLAGGDTLNERLVDLELELSNLGLHMGGAKFTGMRRLDATADLRFADKASGVIALAALAAVQYPRMKVETIRAVGDSRVETVLLKGRAGRKTLARMYDKGVESGTGEPGEWARFEDQRRYGGQHRPDIHRLTASCVREQFHQRFVPLYKANKKVTVGGPMILAQQLLAMVESGKISILEAERIGGYLLMSEAGADYQRSTRYKRRAEARDVGLYSETGLNEDVELVEVNVGDLLERALDSDGWGVG